MRQWLSPLVLQTVQTFQKLTEDIDVAHTIHLGKKEMKIQEDPWDNYLYYDSRYIIPIFCNQESMSIE